MNRHKAYIDLFSEYEKQIRPLIARIEVLKERDPEELYQKVALMIGEFAKTAKRNRMEDEEWVASKYKEVLWHRGELAIMCYLCLIKNTEEKCSRLMKGLKEGPSNPFPLGFLKDLESARSEASVVKKKFYAYKEAKDDLGMNTTETDSPKKDELYMLTDELVDLHRNLYNRYEIVEEYFRNDPELEIKLINLKKAQKFQLWMYQILPFFLAIVVAVISFYFG